MSGLAERVTAALDRSVRPSVIARGAAIRVAGAEGGVVTLEVTGSPGAVFPLAGRIEAAIRAAVPEVTGIRLAAPGAGSDAGPPGAGDGLAGPPGAGDGLAGPPGAGDGLAEAAQRILDAEVNPAIAAHRGHVAVAGGTGGWLHIRLEGGCQGCSLAEVTLRQGIEPLLRARLPDLTGLADVTDHEAGTEPFFSPEKR